MKDFIKWLGVNEKIAKVAVWLLIIMVFLIVFNLSMESMGFPYYAITYENIIKINSTKILQNIITIIINILGFYSITLLVFRIKEAKPMLKYAIIYCIGNFITNIFLGYMALQIYIFLFITIFCYLYSNKNTKYIFYSIASLLFNSVIQSIWYITKVRFVNYETLSNITRSILSLDYFIIIGIIILVKEIYLKKRGEANGIAMGKLAMDRTIQKRRKTSQENSKKSK